MADPIDTDPDDRDPREAELSRRSVAPAISPWLIVGVVAILGAVVYAALALL